MTLQEYDDAMRKLFDSYGFSHYDFEDAPLVAKVLSIEMLNYVIKNEVIESDETFQNSWINVCREELLTRAIESTVLEEV